MGLAASASVRVAPASMIRAPLPPDEGAGFVPPAPPAVPPVEPPVPSVAGPSIVDPTPASIGETLDRVAVCSLAQPIVAIHVTAQIGTPILMSKQ